MCVSMGVQVCAYGGTGVCVYVCECGGPECVCVSMEVRCVCACVSVVVRGSCSASACLVYVGGCDPERMRGWGPQIEEAWDSPRRAQQRLPRQIQGPPPSVRAGVAGRGDRLVTPRPWCWRVWGPRGHGF